MLATFLLTAIPVSIVALLVARLARRRTGERPLALAELGTIMDGALHAFRADMLPLLAASIVMLPLSLSAGVQLWFVGRVLDLESARSESIWRGLLVLGMLGAFGLGQTLLACGVARAHQLRRAGQPVTLRAMLIHDRWRAMLALAAVLALPSAFANMLSLFGALYALHWALAPAALMLEDLGPVAAIKRSVRLVRRHYSGLLNVLVLLWCIGCLLIATPLALGHMFMTKLAVSPLWSNEGLLFLLFVGGSVLVAPLTASGCVRFLLYLPAAQPLAEPAPRPHYVVPAVPPRAIALER